MNKFQFLFVYPNGYENTEFIASDEMPVIGIRISPETVIYPFMFSNNHQGYEASVRGLLLNIYPHPVLLSAVDVEILRHRRDDLNAMFAKCADEAREVIQIPDKGIVWTDEKGFTCAVDFETGERLSADNGLGWGLYKYA